MDHTRSGDDLFVRLDPGEEVHASLRDLADEVGFDAAAITSGIGRTRDHVIGWMGDDGVYHRFEMPEAMELVTMQGLLARMEDGSAFTHIHITVGDEKVGAHAGHLFEATVHVVVEAHLRILPEAYMMRCPVEDSSFIRLDLRP